MFWQQGLSYQTNDVVTRMTWKYSLNPVERSALCFMRHQKTGDLVGGVGICARAWYYEGERVVGGIVSDLVITPAHRALGPALSLCEYAFGLTVSSTSQPFTRAADNANFSLVYGWPNAFSGVLKKRLNFDAIVTVTRFSRPLKWKSVVDSRLPKLAAIPARWLLQLFFKIKDNVNSHTLNRQWHVIEPTSFDRRFDTLWQAAKNHHRLIGDRSAEFLNWRFCNQSSGRNHRLFALESLRGERLGGYVVWSEANGQNVIVKDFLINDDCSAATLLQQFINAMKYSGKNSVSIEFHGCSSIKLALRRLGFITREQSQIMIKTNGVVDSSAFNDDTLFFTAADNDA